MLITLKNNRELLLRRLMESDTEVLYHYLEQLSEASKQRFGPHPFDLQSVHDCCKKTDMHTGFVAVESASQLIVAYAIVKTGYLEHDRFRLAGYGFTPNHATDCALAPSVADAWQSMGVGTALLQYILAQLKTTAVRRVLLWGGVQCDNEKAIQLYKKMGFSTLGTFEYNGMNYDMVLELN